MKQLSYVKQNKEYKEYIQKTIDEYNANDKKTVAFFCDCYYPTVDGVVKVLENYAIKLSKFYNVVVIVPKHKRTVIKNPHDFLLIGTSSLYLRFLNYNIPLPKLDRYLHSCLKKLNVDIVHTHSPFTIGSFSAKLAKKRNIPFVMTMHSQYKLDFKRYVKSEKFASLLTHYIIKVFNKSTETWTMNPKTADVLKSYGYKGEIFLMPNATDYPKPENVLELKKQGQEKYNISPDTKVLLFVGRLVKQKNILFLADVLKKVKENRENIKAFFVGNGPDEDKLKSRIVKNGLESDTIFTGRIDTREELSEIYALSDLFLFPSLYDMSSIVQIEAAGHGLPGVFIDGTPTANTVTHNDTGFLAKNNLDDFSNTVIGALNNDELLKTVSQNAEDKLYLTWGDLMPKICERYEYFMNKKRDA